MFFTIVVSCERNDRVFRSLGGPLLIFSFCYSRVSSSVEASRNIINNLMTLCCGPWAGERIEEETNVAPIRHMTSKTHFVMELRCVFSPLPFASTMIESFVHLAVRVLSLVFVITEQTRW